MKKTAAVQLALMPYAVLLIRAGGDALSKWMIIKSAFNDTSLDLYFAYMLPPIASAIIGILLAVTFLSIERVGHSVFCYRLLAVNVLILLFLRCLAYFQIFILFDLKLNRLVDVLMIFYFTLAVITRRRASKEQADRHEEESPK